MYNYIKILLLSAFLTLPCTTFAMSAVTDVYCPQVITCTNQRCTPIPPKFEQWNTPDLPNGKYYFWQAIVVGAGDCSYRNDPHPNQPAVEFREKLYRPDIYIPNKWDYRTQQSIYVCTTTNPLDCPFYNESDAR